MLLSMMAIHYCSSVQLLQAARYNVPLWQNCCVELLHRKVPKTGEKPEDQVQRTESFMYEPFYSITWRKTNGESDSTEDETIWRKEGQGGLLANSRLQSCKTSIPNSLIYRYMNLFILEICLDSCALFIQLVITMLGIFYLKGILYYM